MSANVQLYLAHGLNDRVEFPSCGIWTNPTGTSNGKEFYSIDLVDWTDKQLITLAACYTAGYGSSSDDSITTALVLKGAQMAVGWYTEVNTYSIPGWLNAYHSKLEIGKNPVVSVNYANSLSYINNNVKNTYVVYRNLTELQNISDVLGMSDTKNLREPNNIIGSKDIGKYNANTVEKVMQQKISTFNPDNYEKTVSDGLYVHNVSTGEKRHIESYIDFNEKYGDFITNSGYTVVLNEQGTVKKIYDNTINKKVSLYNNLGENNFKLTSEEYAFYMNKAKNEADKNVLQEDIKFYYDINKNKKYVNVKLLLENEDIMTEYQYEM